MSQNECGCKDNNCPHKTSEVTLFDGNLNSIVVPAGSSLNDVLLLLESYITTSASNCSVSYTLESASACLGLSAGTYSFQQILEAVISKLCELADSIPDGGLTDITTNDVTLEDITIPACIQTFTGVTSTELFNAILAILCNYQAQIPPDTIDPYNEGSGLQAISFGIVRDFVYGLVDNKSYVYEETTPITSPTSLTITINPIKAVVDGFLVSIPNVPPVALSVNSDTYIRIDKDGTFGTIVQSIGSPAPAVPAGQHPLYKFTTDGAGVVSLDLEYEPSPFGPATIAPNSVDTINIVDQAVTTAKMAIVSTNSTVGHPSILEVTFNDRGQVTSSTSNLNTTGAIDGSILTYSNISSGFEISDPINITASGNFPVANGTGNNYTTSSLSEITTQIESSKKVEINSGAIEDITSALLNVSGNGAIMFPRLTAIQANSLPLLDGFVIYVTDTDVTFTSVGFWGVEVGAWIKL